MLISRTSGGKSCMETLGQELVWQVLVVDRGRLGKVGRERGWDFNFDDGKHQEAFFFEGRGIIEHSGRGSWGEEGCF